MPKRSVHQFLLEPMSRIHPQQAPGSLNPFTGVFQNASVGGVAGRYPVIDATKVGKWKDGVVDVCL